MYDDLCNAITNAYPAVNWFAFQPAMSIAGKMAQAVSRYADDREGEESRKLLVKVGKEASAFLRQHSQNVVPGAAKQLEQCLTALEMEV